MITITVASGKGGTGKTFVSTNIFHALAAQGTRVTLADCDAEAPNATAFFQLNLLENHAVKQQVPVINANTCTFCGLCHEYCNYRAIFYLPDTGIIKVLNDLCHSCGACTVACRFDAITEKEVESGEVNTFRNKSGLKLVEAKMRIGAMTPVPVIKKTISVADDFQDILVLDAPPGYLMPVCAYGRCCRLCCTGYGTIAIYSTAIGENRMTVNSLLSSQIGTHPCLTASPAAYPLIKAAEIIAAKMRNF